MEQATLKVDEDFITMALPKQVADVKLTESTKKTRQTISNSFKKSEMPEEAKVYFDANPREYEKYTNKEAWDKAFDKVSSDIESAKNSIRNKPSLESADDTAEAIATLNRVAEQGNIDELIELTDIISEKATRAGQAIQAIVMLQRTNEDDLPKTQKEMKILLVDNFQIENEEQELIDAIVNI